MQQQMDLDIAVETFSERERRLIEKLREFRTIDVDIEANRRLVNGIGLINEPRITPKAPERDYLPMLKYINVKRTQAEMEIAATVERYVNPSNFGARYATASRVARRLRETFSDDPEEDMRLQDAYRILTDRPEHFDDVRLTDTERTADRRLEERARAEMRLNELLWQKDIISYALDQMKQWYHEWYLILWHRYVMGEPYNKVCQMITRKGENGESGLTPDEYRLARKKALHQFDKWTPGLV